MKKYREIFFYVLTLLGFTCVIYFIINRGQNNQPELTSALPQPSGSAFEQFKSTWIQNLHHPLGILLLQIITIILAARVFGFICKKIKQPTVIGEIAAGIVFRPSVIWTNFPDFFSFLFSPASFGYPQFLT